VAITPAELKLVALIVIIAMALAVIPAIRAYRESIVAALRG
jgi:ABC-type antimicrobial peptide transport system permease subunit